MDFTDEQITVERALKQIERNCYETLKVEGETFRVPIKAQVELYLKSLFDCMASDDWVKVAEVYKEVLRPGKAKTGGKRKGRPRGKFYGMSAQERKNAENEMAKALGVWHIRYPDGCIDCGESVYAHVTGGLCGRCTATIRSLGLTVKDYRTFQKTGKLET